MSKRAAAPKATTLKPPTKADQTAPKPLDYEVFAKTVADRYPRILDRLAE